MLYIDPKIVKKCNLSMEEFYLLLSIRRSPTVLATLGDLERKGLVTKSVKGSADVYIVGSIAQSKIKQINIESRLTPEEDTSRIDNLILQLQAIYPEGKNLNGQYWRCNKTDLKRKLILFLSKYGDYTDEQIIAATQAYVDSFKGSMKYMRLLKYFIWKEEIKDGSKVLVSELADIIENGNQVTNDDWTTELR